MEEEEENYGNNYRNDCDNNDVISRMIKIICVYDDDDDISGCFWLKAETGADGYSQ